MAGPIYDQSTSKLYGHIVIMVIITSLTISIEFDIEMWQKTGRQHDTLTVTRNILLLNVQDTVGHVYVTVFLVVWALFSRVRWKVWTS